MSRAPWRRLRPGTSGLFPGRNRNAGPWSAGVGMRMDVRREPVRLKDLGGLAADILDTVEDGFYILDADWRFVYANPRACEMLGLPRDAVIGQNYWERLPEMLGTAAGARLREAARADDN